MKRFISVVIVLLLAIGIRAQEASLEHTNVLKVKFGWNYQLDTYLSPFAYRGLQVGIGNEWWQPFRQDSRLGQTGRLANWAHIGRLDIRGFQQISSARSNIIRGLGGTAGWGAFYCWQWQDNRLKVLLGPYLETELNIREISSNVNKPYSFDVSAEVMAMGGVSWSFYGKKTSYRLHYLVRTNLIGF
ncbi:MAG: hypothetical protein II452_00005, partial [Paludibacteraceae bacterium]|nr:hypothetical protein [Paludibacteraceae bacterium]